MFYNVKILNFIDAVFDIKEAVISFYVINKLSLKEKLGK